MACSAWLWNSSRSASIAFLACLATAISCLLCSSSFLLEISIIFLWSCDNFTFAARFISSSSCSWASRTLHHSPKNFAVSMSSAFSRSRVAFFRSICALRLFWISSCHLPSMASFSKRFRSSSASFCFTWFSTRSSSLLDIWASLAACVSIILFLSASFARKTSSSFCLRSWSIFSFRWAYSVIFCPSFSIRRSSSALICLRYSLAF
mmetsp:Transcript_6419/g.13158  ORF Transcript_6419/g.13158 Transcript_6419/m.13158 type:complete len:207 (+) Transcript_6419:307-927(+)